MLNVRFRSYDVLLIVFFLVILARGFVILDYTIITGAALGILIYVCKLLVIMEMKKQEKRRLYNTEAMRNERKIKGNY